MQKCERINFFHEYVRICINRLGLTHTGLAMQLSEDRPNPLPRTFAWDWSHRATKMQAKRDATMMKLATLLKEPLSKLLFLCGINPWAKIIPLQKQGAMWEFMERLTRAMQDNTGKPPATIYVRLCNELFGGAEVVTKVSLEEMAEFLRNIDESE